MPAGGVTLAAPRLPADAPVVCPACGGENSPDAVFCATAACHKALGDFRYVREEIAAEARLHEKLAERVTGFIGKPQFLVVHGLWFALWVAINTGVIAMGHSFDDYPFGLLGIILSVEAIFITGFLLISSNRQSQYANKRAELDYEVNVRTYRRVKDLDPILRELVERLARLESTAPPAGRG